MRVSRPDVLTLSFRALSVSETIAVSAVGALSFGILEQLTTGTIAAVTVGGAVLAFTLLLGFARGRAAMLRGETVIPSPADQSTSKAASGRVTGPGATGDLALDRLEFQAAWYETHANQSRVSYQIIKGVQIVAAALVPVVITLSSPGWIAASLGAGVVVLEGFQGNFKFHDNWISYRNAREALMREKYLYLIRAGVYAGAPEPQKLLAEHVEMIAGEEHVSWLQAQELRPKDATRAKST